MDNEFLAMVAEVARENSLSIDTITVLLELQTVVNKKHSDEIAALYRQVKELQGQVKNLQAMLN